MLQYKGVDSTPRESAFARFTKSKDKRGARTGKTFSKRECVLDLFNCHCPEANMINLYLQPLLKRRRRPKSPLHPTRSPSRSVIGISAFECSACADFVSILPLL